MTESAGVLLHVTDGIAYVTIDRPHRANALDDAGNRLLHRLVVEADNRKDVDVLVISGSGERSFCAGADLGDPPGRGAAGDEPRVSFGGGLTGVAGPLVKLRKPIIAAVNGAAIGGGFELAMACDVIVASSDASFALPEAAIGFVSDSPCVHRVVRALPHHVGMGLILTGRRLPAVDAFRYGLVNEVAEPAALPTVAKNWAKAIQSASPAAARAVKEAALEGLQRPLDLALATRWETIEEYQFSPDRTEGVRAFAERREPRWDRS